MSDITLLVNFYPTTRCNVGCSHCIDDACMKNPIDLPIEYVHLLNKQLEKHQYYAQYCATGNGEPLLHPKFNALIDSLFSYRRNKGMTLLTAGYNNKELEKRDNFRRLLQKDYIRRIQPHLSFNLYSDFPERWDAVLPDIMNCERDFSVLANICYSVSNRLETLKSFDDIFRRYALNSGYGENLRALICGGGSQFCLRAEPLVDSHGFPYHERQMLLPQNFIYFLSGKHGRRFFGVRRAHIAKQGRAAQLREIIAGKDYCPDFLSEFNLELHLNPDGFWYANHTCPKIPQLCLGHIEKDDIDVIVRRKFFFWRFINSALILERRNYDPMEPCAACLMLCNEHDVMSVISEIAE